MRQLEPARPGAVRVSVTVAPDGDAITAWAAPADHARLHERITRPSGSIHPNPRPDTRVRVRVARDGLDGRVAVAELAVRVGFPSIHAMPNGQWLVIGARTWWRERGPDDNAFLYDADGALVRSGCVGDGVQHAQTTASGAIWVGYFDEGVFGNYGWGGAGPAPIGATGVNRFDDRFARVEHAGEYQIADCYALTTSGETCWVCPYTDWPILQLGGPTRAAYANRVDGASALIEHGRRVALVGGYGKHRSRVVVGRLEGDRLIVERRGRLDLSRDAELVGRDGVLHVFAESTWTAWSLSALSEAAAPARR
jgi:hypothetical protein